MRSQDRLKGPDRPHVARHGQAQTAPWRHRTGRALGGLLAVGLLVIALGMSAGWAGAKGVVAVAIAICGMAAGVWAAPTPFGSTAHVTVAPGTRFLEHLAREFERSRRHNRSFVLARLTFESAPAARGAAGTFSETLRQSDVLGIAGKAIFLILAESDSEEARLAIKRQQASVPNFTTSLASYPLDGTTVGRLLERIGDRNDLAPGDGDFLLDAYRDLPETGQYGRQPAVVQARTESLRLKRVVDLIVLAALAPIALPVGVLLALAVRLDSKGRALFVQERTGLYGHRFKMYKFRSMVHNAAELKESLQHLNILEPPDFKVINDPRITRVGRFLRATSLDELPQLLNVLRGDMTLVGPRPTSFAAETYDNWHTQRLEVPPGITGLWQVSARHESGFDERLRLDVGYISSMSLWTDARIVGRTFTSVLKAKGA